MADVFLWPCRSSAENSNKGGSPLRRLGVTVLLMYMLGIVCFLWSSYFVCQYENHQPPILKLSRSSWEVESRGSYTVILNYVQSELLPDKESTVTLVSTATLTELHHIPTVCKRWQGPMSVAVYTPGSDLKSALQYIFQMRSCSDPCVRQNVTWHMYYDSELGPGIHEMVSAEEAALLTHIDCRNPRYRSSFRSHVNLPFPANVGRNVARLKIRTQSFLNSDLNLYPSADVIQHFMKLKRLQGSKTRRVYVLPVFQVRKGQKPPALKSELLEMVAEGHVITSPSVNKHYFPNAEVWLRKTNQSNSVSMNYVTSKSKDLSAWQPFFISSASIPLFPEELTIEGRHDRDALFQELCLQNYDFQILDNAFLVQVSNEEGPTIKDVEILQSFVQENNRARKKLSEFLMCKYGVENIC